MKKDSVSRLLNHIVCAFRAIVNANALALKKKTRALKARLIIHSLLAADRNFLVSSISENLHPFTPSPTTHQDHLPDPQQDASDDLQTKPTSLHHDRLSHSLPSPHHHCEQARAGVRLYDDEKYPELRHSLFEAAEGFEEGSGGSVIEMVKHSKEEAGEEFSLEEDIDHVADLFIRNFHRQMRMQKQQSLKRRGNTKMGAFE